jgi:hypothetical protein
VDEQRDTSAAADAAEPDLEDIGLRWDAAMRRGDFEAAWRQTDRIELPRRARQRDPAFVREPQHLKWNGEPFDGRDVLVRCEHGLGDTLQFIRYVPLVRSRARSVRSSRCSTGQTVSASFATGGATRPCRGTRSKSR